MEFVKESHYQLACTRYYELTHGVSFFSFNNNMKKKKKQEIQLVYKIKYITTYFTVLLCCARG